MSTNEEWLAAGRPEPVAAEEHDGAESCAYDDCENDADYRVEWRTIDGGNYSYSTICDECSQENRIWVAENDLLDQEFRGPAKE